MAVLASPCLHKTGSQSLLFTCRVCVFVLYMTEAATWSARCAMTCCCTHGQPFARRNDILVVVKQGGVQAGTDLGATTGALLGRPRRRDSLSDSNLVLMCTDVDTNLCAGTLTHDLLSQHMHRIYTTSSRRYLWRNTVSGEVRHHPAQSKCAT